MNHWTFILLLFLLIPIVEIEAQGTNCKSIDEMSIVPGDLICFPEVQYQLGGGSPVTEETLDSLDAIIEFLKVKPNLRVELGCHTDTRGSEEANIKLTERRSSWLVEYFISNGISRDRLMGVGYGESKLIITNKEIANTDSKDEKEKMHQINRRTEMRILE